MKKRDMGKKIVGDTADMRRDAAERQDDEDNKKRSIWWLKRHTRMEAEMRDYDCGDGINAGVQV